MDELADRQPMRQQAADGVKSADRVIALFELFRGLRRAAGAREIADALDMPRSSTNVLLRSLIARGYLAFDPSALSYFPTLRLFQLGSWLLEGFVGDPVLDQVMEVLAETTGETVCLWAPVGLKMQVSKVHPSPQAIALSVREGDQAPICRSTVGLAWLAGLGAEAVERLVGQHNTADPVPLEPAAVLRELAMVRLRGVAIGYERWKPDAGAVAVRLDGADPLREGLVLAVGGPVFRVQRGEALIEAALGEALARLAAEAGLKSLTLQHECS